MREVLGAPASPTGNGAAPLDYQFAVNGERFVVLDAHTEAVPDPLGRLSDAQLEVLASVCQAEEGPVTVLLHYMPFTTASPWLNEHMILINGDALHETLLPARDRLRGVFFGHLHRSCQVMRDGITYICAPSTCLQYGWRPRDEEPRIDDGGVPGYNVVQYFPRQVVVTAYVV
jgi:hypothetical protein